MGLFSKLFNKEGEDAQQQSETVDKIADGPDQSDDEPDAESDNDTTEFTARTDKPRKRDVPPHKGPPPTKETPARAATPPVLMPETVVKKGQGPAQAPPPPAGTGPAVRTPAASTGVMSAASVAGRASPPPPVPKAAAPGTQSRREARRPASHAGKRPAHKEQSRDARRGPSPAKAPPSPARGRSDKEGRPAVGRPALKPAPSSARSATAKGREAGSPKRPVKEARVEADDDQVVEAAIDALQSLPSPGEAAPTEAAADDARAVTETFAAIAAAHTQPLSDFMAQLAMGATPSRWAVPLRAVIAPVLDAAQQMELKEMVSGFEAFDSALSRAAAERSPHISRAVRDELEEAYGRMVAQLPETFRATRDGDGRGRILLEALLLQIPSLRRRTLARLYAAGLQDLEQLIAASPEEVAQVAGIEASIASAITQRLERFNRERARAEPAALRSLIYEQLRSAVERLSKLHAELDRAREAEAVRQKRTARRGLQASALEVDALLAQLGELALIEELKRMPVHHKIARVQSYLEQAQAA
ncbi:MAG: hypothetical protein OXR73_30930 [Myxococcales bacterium]|nr:hypothetical protein [Myxococcales bacterium]